MNKPSLYELIKGSKHIAATMLVFAGSAAVLLLAISAEKVGVPLGDAAWGAVEAFLTVVSAAALAAVGVSSGRHWGEGKSGRTVNSNTGSLDLMGPQ